MDDDGALPSPLYSESHQRQTASWLGTLPLIELFLKQLSTASLLRQKLISNLDWTLVGFSPLEVILPEPRTSGLRATSDSTMETRTTRAATTAKRATTATNRTNNPVRDQG